MGQSSLPAGEDTREPGREGPGGWHAECNSPGSMKPSDPRPSRDEQPLRRLSPPRVADLMRREFITVAAAESLLEARRTMQLARLRHLLVVEEGRLVGIISYRDLQEDALERAEGESLDRWRDELREVAVREAMVPSPYFVGPDTPADEAALRMVRLHLGCLPVCESSGDEARLVGILAESDLLLAAWR